MVDQTISEMFKSGNLKDIPEYEGLYAASQNGRIWAYPRQRSSKFGKWIKQQLYINTENRNKAHSHYSVGLYKDKNRKLFQAHRLVALTFISNPNNFPQINHKDGNSLNNHIANLEWCDNSHNLKHAIKDGLFDIHSGDQDKTRTNNGKMTGASNGAKSLRKFTMDEAKNIKAICKLSGKSIRKIAQAYGVSWHAINKIAKNLTYQFEVKL